MGEGLERVVPEEVERPCGCTNRRSRDQEAKNLVHDSFNVIPSRLLWAGPLTILASVAAVICVRVVAVGIVHPAARFAPLRWGPPIIDTAILVTCAVLVFGFVATMSSNPIRTFRIIAASALLLSFIPDVLLAIRHSFGGGWPEALALMSMHVAAWLVTVSMLIGLTAVKTDAADVRSDAQST